MKKISLTVGLVVSMVAQAKVVKSTSHLSGSLQDVSMLQSCLYDLSKMAVAKADPQSLKQRPQFVGNKVAVNEGAYYLDGQRLYRAADDSTALKLSGEEAKRAERAMSHDLLKTYWMIAANAIEQNATYDLQDQLKVLRCADVFVSPKAKDLAMAAANQIGSRHGNNETLTKEGLDDLNPDHK